MKKRANNILYWIILFCLTLVGLFLIVSETISTSSSYKIVFTLIFVYISFMLFFHLTHTTYICENGIAIYHYGKITKHLIWNDISQICTMKLLPISMKVSSPSFILIVPNGCEKYRRDKEIGYLFLLRYRQYIYRIDDTPGNRQLINQFYGELDIQN